MPKSFKHTRSSRCPETNTFRQAISCNSACRELASIPQPGSTYPVNNVASLQVAQGVRNAAARVQQLFFLKVAWVHAAQKLKKIAAIHQLCECR